MYGVIQCGWSLLQYVEWFTICVNCRDLSAVRETFNCLKPTQ